ncbi:hypothetical protein [Domibacillus indicus]|uniref:hypothetical protein n=1 Tax=Domibacillus indicus TaxID=1437523 RepID=UPI000617D62A|nr:hypothetical protein [Domibacillus indicus]
MDLTMFTFTEGKIPAGTVFSWTKDIDILAASVKKGLGTDSLPVAASMFMRRYGLFIAGHLAVFSAERRIWTGTPDEIEVVIGEGEAWPILFQLSHQKWEKCGEEGAEKIAARLVDPVVKLLAKNARLPAVISRENIFGYVLWMYVHIVKDTRDLPLLKQYERFLQNRTPEEAMANFSRLTCCLYKEVPGCEKCSYCPLLKEKQCGTAKTL